MSHKAIFFDRDDTLIEDPGYINSPKQVKLMPGASESLVQLREMGYKLVIVTNQSGIARGIVTLKALGLIHKKLEELLSRDGASIDRIYYCPYHPDGVIAKYRRNSDLRKPNPGMLLIAADEMDINLKQSWMVGNSYRDIAAGVNAGCKTILIKSSIKPATKSLGDPTPDKEAINIKEVVNIIKMYDRKIFTASKNKVKSKMVKPAVETKKAVEPVKRRITEQKQRPENENKPQNTANIETTNRLLEEVLKTLKVNQRENMFNEFSWLKVIAGAIQVLVFFCLVLSLRFLMDSESDFNSLLTTFGYAVVLQLMAIAFYIMRDRK